jgi:hypothetical protein
MPFVTWSTEQVNGPDLVLERPARVAIGYAMNQVYAAL